MQSQLEILDDTRKTLAHEPQMLAEIAKLAAEMSSHMPRLDYTQGSTPVRDGAGKRSRAPGRTRTPGVAKAMDGGEGGPDGPPRPALRRASRRRGNDKQPDRKKAGIPRSGSGDRKKAAGEDEEEK